MARNTSTEFIKRTIFILFAAALTLLSPSVASFAEPTAPNDTSNEQSQAATNQPTGDDATTYHYNSTTGKWENEHYIWDPTTRKTTPKDNLPYSYNPATGKWDTAEWRYNGTTGKWEPNTISVAQPPAGSQTVGSPVATNVPTTPSGADPQDTTSAESAPLTTSTTPVDPSNGTATAFFDGFYNAAISNTITSTAISGDAAVVGNNTAGSATSGNAGANSTVFNMLQSTAGFSNLADVHTFVVNVDKDMVGDLYLDPSRLANLQPAGANGTGQDVQVNIAQNNNITNNLTVGALSGDATVSANNVAGDASTGSANAVANLVNLISSSIAANQSFIGTLNINGSLDGDILLPPDVLQTLLANNAPTTTVSLSPEDSANLHAALSDNQLITNNIQTTAASGNATVTGNNTAGSAKTGNGMTNITVLNLTGRQIVGSDSLLVFVNVLGKWVGALVNAPQGSTAGAYGSGITENSAVDINGSLDATNNNTITNNVKAVAQSGDASVEHNRAGGSATSGNATASANVSNVTNSHASLSGWFGVLFINVFGSWLGSFGVDTDAGGKAQQNTSNTDVSTTTKSSTPAVRAFRFTTATTSGNTAHGTIGAEVDAQAAPQPEATPQVLGTDTATGSGPQKGATPANANFSFPLGALSLGGGLFAAERAFAKQRHSRH